MCACKYLAAALGNEYLAADCALRVSTEAVTPPGVLGQQHTPAVETLGGDREPSESELGVTGVVVVQAQ